MRIESWSRRPRWQRGLFLFALAALLLLAIRWWPHPRLADQVPGSTAVLAEGGELLRLTLASDGQYQFWVPLEQMAPSLPRAVQLYEDRWFGWHPGVNPAALLRSAVATWGGEKRQGGSTITMQLARQLYRLDSRNVTGKLRQIGAALWLEVRYSKHEILETYLNIAPYGGNLRGVGAASQVYFRKRAQDLSLPEVLSLAVIPQNPRRRLAVYQPGQPQELPAVLASARQRLWQLWLARHPEDAGFAADMNLPLRPGGLKDLPFLAPHLTDMLLRQHPGEREVRSTLNLRMQTTLQRMLGQYVDQHRAIGITNASALLIDSKLMEVKALVGSADYFGASIDGQVNGTQARRSPGSTLKPFIYGLAIDQGVLHPLTMLKDAPTAFGPFSPENFDGRFVGPISAQEALIRSRNVPAVSVAARISQPNLYDFLKSAGVSKMESESHYGLALALGGGELTMEELARLYAMLANQGVLRPLRYEQSPADRQPGLQLLSEEAAFIVRDMLARNPRPDTFAPARDPVSWKTGTSWGFRDAWTAGIFGRYVLVVWVGNFDGRGNPAFVGVRAAAPLFFQIVDSLRGQHQLEASSPDLPPQGVRKVAVCADSGDLPNAWCPRLANTWFIPGKSPIKLSTLHRPVYIDTRSGQAVCAPGPETRTEVHEFWPSNMQRLFREAGMPRRPPPAQPVCQQGDLGGAGEAPQITSPLRAVTYSQRLSQPTPIALRANRAGRGTLYWFANQGFVGRSLADEALAWTPARAGTYVLRVLDESGRADTRDVNVEFLP